MNTTEPIPLHLVGTQPVRSVQPVGDIHKAADHRGRPHFVLPTRFTLADGSTAAYPVTARRRKDLPNYLTLMQGLASRGHLDAGVQSGHVVKTVTRIG